MRGGGRGEPRSLFKGSCLEKDEPSGGKTIMYPLSSTASGFQLCRGKETGSASPRGRLVDQIVILPLMSSGSSGGFLLSWRLDFSVQ